MSFLFVNDWRLSKIFIMYIKKKKLWKYNDDLHSGKMWILYEFLVSRESMKHIFKLCWKLASVSFNFCLKIIFSQKKTFLQVETIFLVFSCVFKRSTLNRVSWALTTQETRLSVDPLKTQENTWKIVSTCKNVFFWVKIIFR